MKNINREVGRYIENHLQIKKNLAENLINVRALARKIKEDSNLSCSLNAVISAIRRYHSDLEEDDPLPKIYALLRDAKLQTRTKLVSLLLKKSELVRDKLTKLYQKIDFQGGDTLRIFEVNKYIKIIVDEKNHDEAKGLFLPTEVVTFEKNLGELTIIYKEEITKIPGVFAFISNELATNNISIIDSMICHAEHLVILKEKDLQKAFNTLFVLMEES